MMHASTGCLSLLLTQGGGQRTEERQGQEKAHHSAPWRGSREQPSKLIEAVGVHGYLMLRLRQHHDNTGEPDTLRGIEDHMRQLSMLPGFDDPSLATRVRRFKRPIPWARPKR